MPSGTVKWFDAKKGYGYIQPDGGEGDVRVNSTEVIASGIGPLLERQRLNYDLQPGYGTTIAVNLRSPFSKGSKPTRR
jgi:CspA family cold shock protein